ncbi:MAG: RNA-binding protein [Bacteroidetes bacterium]|nr:MAG: RNA-binding protein [Bacteroidota bacterium]
MTTLRSSSRNSRFIPKMGMFICLAFTLLFLTCKEKRPFLDDPDGLREVEETITAPDPLLKLLPVSQTGLDFQNIILETDEDNFYTNGVKYNGGGLAILDVNNDNLQDLYFVSVNGKNKLFLNQGGFKFKDITDQAGVGAANGFKTGVAIVDINNDGWQDIYVCRAGVAGGDIRRNLLFINNGDQTFTNQAKAYHLDIASASTSANFFDYDNDGDLDLYLLNYPSSGEYSNIFETKYAPDGKTIIPITKPKAPEDSDLLLRNDGAPQPDGSGGFTNVAEKSGIWNSAYGLSVAVSDLNRDGFPDVYVSNDFVRPDNYYINNGNGTFTDKLQESFWHTSRHTMGSDLTDFDNDGLIDLFTVDMMPITNYRLKTTKVTMTQALYSTTIQAGYYEPVVRNVLQRNNGNGTFSDVGCLADVHATEWSWSGLVFDMDNDGNRDIHVTNGYRRNVNDNDFFEFQFEEIIKLVDSNNLKAYFNDIHQFLRLIPTYKSRNSCFRNQGNWTFENMEGKWLTLPATWSNGAAWTDLDNDGDLDLVVNNMEDQPFVYQNLTREKSQGNYLQVKLRGSAQNRDAIGASALLFYNGKQQYLELNPIRGIFSSVENLFHFGLGQAGKADKLVVRWPDGKTQTITDIPANQRLELNYADASGYVRHLVPLQPQNQYFQEVTRTAGLNFQHRENAFNDFEAWPLNMIRESDLGPLMAVGDVNGDGWDDLFIGNAFDQPAALFIQTANQQFRPASTATWEQDKIYEDHDAAFFDADGDGDQDLYVVSGGMEAVSDQAWQDRLYLNDGKGNFSKAPDALPLINTVGMRVLSSDFDQDGDQDLLVGGRVTGSNWPLTPRTLLLQNDGTGHFTNATERLAPALERCGMITDMLLAELDGQPGPELVVCGEWMPIQVFRFSGSQWVPAELPGFEKSDGLWSSLAVADLDGDGDLDLLAGNLGLNSRLKASETAPIRVFAGDFDDNRTLDPIVTLPEAGKDYPMVQKMVMHKHIPKTKKKYLFSRDYSQATIEDMFPEDKLNSALQLAAYTLETCWWENQNGRFVRHALPPQAQVSPVQAMICADFTGDGLQDILMAGNKYGLEVETNRLDAGNGTLLQGNGKGQFTFVENYQSGLWANREVRDVAVLRGTGGRSVLVVSNNNGPLQAFAVKKTPYLQ